MFVFLQTSSYIAYLYFKKGALENSKSTRLLFIIFKINDQLMAWIHDTEEQIFNIKCKKLSKQLL